MYCTVPHKWKVIPFVGHRNTDVSILGAGSSTWPQSPKSLIANDFADRDFL